MRLGPVAAPGAGDEAPVADGGRAWRFLEAVACGVAESFWAADMAPDVAAAGVTAGVAAAWAAAAFLRVRAPDTAGAGSGTSEVLRFCGVAGICWAADVAADVAAARVAAAWKAAKFLREAPLAGGGAR